MNNGNAGSIPAPVLTEQGDATGSGTGVLTVPHRLPHNLDIEINALRKGWGEWCEEYMKLAAALAAKDKVIAEFDFDVVPKLDARVKDLEAAIREWDGKCICGCSACEELFSVPGIRPAKESA